MNEKHWTQVRAMSWVLTIAIIVFALWNIGGQVSDLVRWVPLIVLGLIFSAYRAKKRQAKKQWDVYVAKQQRRSGGAKKPPGGPSQGP